MFFVRFTYLFCEISRIAISFQRGYYIVSRESYFEEDKHILYHTREPSLKSVF